MTLPPPSYARQSGEVIAAQLAAIGLNVQLQNMEWAQWLSSTFGGVHDFDLSIISHVEPLDMVKYTGPDYYRDHDSKKFRELYTR
jgi:peptide/nickel transport system substrate-binding protein